MPAKAKKINFDKKTKTIISTVVGVLALIIFFALAFGTPGSETVFKDMNDKMLQVKSVTIDQTSELTMAGGGGKISSKMYLDMNSSKDMNAIGDFSMSMKGDQPFSISGDVVKVGNDEYVKISDLSSSSSDLSANFAAIEAKLGDEWIKIRSKDSFASLASSAIDFVQSVLPTPYANLNDTQRKDVLTLLQDKSMYTIDEVAKVDTAGVSAYKYSLKYNKDHYKKVAKAISGYVPYFDSGDDSDSEIKALTIWVNINTRQIIKIAYEGTSSDGSMEGTISFSEYNQSKSVEKPSDYSIESELLE
ncbi:MAG: hypothetical protein WA087_01820 [Candidatus Saccharimonadales bacterium]